MVLNHRAETTFVSFCSLLLAAFSRKCSAAAVDEESRQLTVLELGRGGRLLRFRGVYEEDEETRLLSCTLEGGWLAVVFIAAFAPQCSA